MVYVLLGIIVFLIHAIILRGTKTMEKLRQSDLAIKIIVGLAMVFCWPVILVMEGILFLINTVSHKTE